MNRNVLLCTAWIAIGCLGWSASSWLGPRQTPSTTSSAAGHAAVPTTTLTLSDGVKVESYVAVARALLDPETGATVVPIVAEVEITIQGQQMARARALRVMTVGSEEAITWDLYGITPTALDPIAFPQVTAKNYRFTITPAAGATWGAVRETQHTQLQSSTL